MVSLSSRRDRASNKAKIALGRRRARLPAQQAPARTARSRPPTSSSSEIALRAGRGGAQGGPGQPRHRAQGDERARRLGLDHARHARRSRGTVLEVPVEVGNSVIEANNFNDGTTIASIADMDDMIFKGKVDESEVGKIRQGMELELTIGAFREPAVRRHARAHRAQGRGGERRHPVRDPRRAGAAEGL